MMRASPVVIFAAVLVALAIGAVVWLVTQERGPAPPVRFEQPATASYPALDVRVSYDASVFTAAPYDQGADYPMRLDAQGWSFYGKRIGGMGTILKPGPQVYDYVTNHHDEALRSWYGLQRAEDPVYTDIQLAGQPALHTSTRYVRPESARDWPLYFPDSVRAGDEVYIEGWVLLTEQDLFFFYAVSPTPLSQLERTICTATIERIQFGAVLGGEITPPTTATPEGDAGAGATPDQTSGS